MARLYSDLSDGSGQRYYYGLNSAPGGISPAVGALQIQGLAPTIFQEVVAFRTPAVATLTINGQQVGSGPILLPAQATLSLQGLAPTLQTTIIVTNAMTPDYTNLQELVPTILFIQTVTPAPAVLTLQSLALNVTPGGNIGFITPGVGSLSLQGLAPTIINNQPNVGLLSLVGQIPVLQTTRIVEPAIGSLTVNGQTPRLDLPFQWIDADPPPTTTWTTTTGVAA